jgi:hypothetical protein
MKIRFYIDPETDLPHSYKHDIFEDEVEDMCCSIRARIARARKAPVSL